MDSAAEETDGGNGGGCQAESEVEETDAGEDGGSLKAGAGAGCSVPCAMRVWA